MLNSWKRNSYVAAYICITNFLMTICYLNLILDLSSQIFYHAWQEYVLELKRQSRYSILLYLKHNESDSLTFCLTTWFKIWMRLACSDSFVFSKAVQNWFCTVLRVQMILFLTLKWPIDLCTLLDICNYCIVLQCLKVSTGSEICSIPISTGY